jgi:PII-like signaling protein
MSDDGCVKLTTYFGERARADGGFLADALVDVYARHELQVSLVMRGIEGFGAKHQMRTDRLLSLSEDLPLVAVAVDHRARINAALEDLRALPRFSGLVTLERARMLTEHLDAPGPLTGTTKLTVYVGRHQRVGRLRAHEAVVALLHRCGIAGATVLLGIDGTVSGVRKRARFFAGNPDVPVMVIAVGDADHIAGALSELDTLLERPLVTLERVEICKRDGELLTTPTALPETDPSGLPMWQKLMVFASEQSMHDGRPLHRALVSELHRAGATGATSLRGVWGYHGDHAPHGDRFWQLHRHVPALVTIIDTPTQIQRWFAIVDRLTDHTGLVISEMVPALQMSDQLARPGDLGLAERPA